eukprot:TRINITY_DN7722_c0_g1_i2.p2 TRINITY_DN7722_c0_g1~~TRINITY_DN7722_c0_g1_i2.p2  ORF type:complete len:593 (+),score=94.23 TRINITY_DN7722_c0_g1_i2:2216-3994(+)
MDGEALDDEEAEEEKAWREKKARKEQKKQLGLQPEQLAELTEKEKVKEMELPALVKEAPAPEVEKPEKQRRNKMIMELDQIELTPFKLSTLLFQQQATVTGRYQCKKVYLHLGTVRLCIYRRGPAPTFMRDNVALSHVITQSSLLTLLIENTLPSLSLGVQRASCLALRHPHTIRLVIDSHNDSFKSATLQLTAQPASLSLFADMNSLPAQIVLAKPVAEQKTKTQKVTWQGTVPLDRTQGAVTLPPLHAHQYLMVDLPVLATEASSPHHLLSGVLEYVRTTGEVQTVPLSTPLQFVDPFSCHATFVPFEDKIFLQISVRSMLPTPVCINNYRMALPTACKIAFDPNPIVRGETLRPGQELSFAFDLEATANDAIRKAPAELACEFEFDFVLLEQPPPLATASPSPTETDVRTFKHPVVLPNPKIQYLIELLHDDILTHGQVVDAEFSVTYLSRSQHLPPPGSRGDSPEHDDIRSSGGEKSVDTEKTLQYEIIHTGDWIVVGHNKRVFNIKPGERKTFGIQLLSLVCGLVETPRVSLSALINHGSSSATPSKICVSLAPYTAYSSHSARQQVQVNPFPRCHAYCSENPLEGL